MRFKARFSLRTLFIAIALFSLPLSWICYQLHWIQERHAWLGWLESHATGGNFEGPAEQPRLGLPWSLAILREQPLDRYYYIRPEYHFADDMPFETLSLPEFRKCFARVTELFPETQFVAIEDPSVDDFGQIPQSALGVEELDGARSERPSSQGESNAVQ